MKPLLRLSKIGKEFDGVSVLRDVDFVLNPGEIHAIVGENGAGKSTLMKIIAGVYPKNTYIGDIILNGELMKFSNVSEAEDSGIVMIPQEITIADELSVAENILLNNLPGKFGIVNWDSAYKRAEELIDLLNISVKPDMIVKYLRTAKRQLIMIAKALHYNAKILILDEPTTTLTEEEKKLLFKKLKELKKEGLACIYITHRLEELEHFADKITIMRDGDIIKTCDFVRINQDEIISLMVGREITEMYPEFDKKRVKDEITFEVKNLSVYDPETGRLLIKDVSFSARKGEILGVFGLVGAGRTELALSIYGAWKGKITGEVYVNGEKANNQNPTTSIDSRLSYLSEDRKALSILDLMTVKFNISISSLSKDCRLGVINDNKEVNRVSQLVKDLNIKTYSINTLIKSLSGGNQQKTIIARLLAQEPDILILDEPTYGVDVGARHEIYNILGRLAEEGKTIIFISSDINEVVGISDGTLVMRRGELIGKVDSNFSNINKIMRFATLGHA